MQTAYSMSLTGPRGLTPRGRRAAAPAAMATATAATAPLRASSRCAAAAVAASRSSAAVPMPSLAPRGLAAAPLRQPQRNGRAGTATAAPAALPAEALGVAAFFAPGAAILLYAFVKGKGNLKDGLSRLLTDVSQGYFQPDVGGKTIPVAEGELSDLAGDEPLFKALYKWFLESGGVYKLVFGPKAFVVVSDPVVVRHILKENAFNYDKGVLAEILEPIMGKGLIPADLETWKVRRRAVVPAFHRQYYDAMVAMFARCTQVTVDKLDTLLTQAEAQQQQQQQQQSGGGGSPASVVVNMETEFLNLGLDIIGLGVFNYDFGSITTESPVIKAVYGVLKEAEHRSTFYIPYWNVPLLRAIVPRQRAFAADMKVIDATLDALIRRARETRQEDDLEALQARDYANVKDPSLLRFLVDMRGEDATDKQLRDDLMTMLIAGHETTAAVLTWALFSVAQAPEVEAKLLAEIDAAIGDRTPGLDDIKAMPYLRATLAESLRMFPQPPLLIRRSLAPDTLPPGLGGDPAGYPIGKGADIFISVWNLHRSPHLWKDPDVFRPERYEEAFTNPAFGDAWAGYQPEAGRGALYPNEVASDFAFIPFGGGARKCVGDQFALFEATVAFAMLLRRFEFKLAATPKEIGMATGATIHTANGMMVRVARRKGAGGGAASGAGSAQQAAPAAA